MESVTFGNDSLGNIMGKGTIILDNGRCKAHKVLFVDGLNHNLLSLSQMCDQGYDASFRSKYYEIKSKNTRKVIIKYVRTLNNVYIRNKFFIFIWGSLMRYSCGTKDYDT